MNRDSDLFADALALPKAERAAFLDRMCAGDPAQRARIEELLAGHEEAEQFMEAPVAPRDSIREEKPGDRIGRYKLLQRIGEGGCGVVYMAEQDEPVRRRVALKVIKLGMDTKEVIARFEAERQALALMDHPNIARVFDAGATDNGRPYFVMELVKGVPITRYCDEQNVPTRQRLELFTQVCHAIQHAHQKGIIHRDIKPSNILVSLHDDVAVPKVIDFGIAKATHGRLTDHTLFTAFEQFIGTPAYMSPEQAEFNGLDVDTRSDIYSLGVLLYELLTGRPPFDPRTLVSAGLDEIRRVIREVDPPRPSTRLSTLGDADRITIARQRATAPAQLSSQLRGDLDWIVMMTLEKNRARRYETANALALDILRHLHDEPVMARPPSAVYRFRKFARRNKLGFGAGAAMAATIVIGGSVAVWQAVRATRAENIAARERDVAQAARAEEAKARELAEQREKEVATISDLILSEALSSVAPRLQSHDPTMKAAMEGREITVREVLDRAAARIPTEFAGNPRLEAALRTTIGETYLKLSLFEKALPHVKAAWEIRRRVLGDRHPDTLRSLRALVAAHSNEGKLDDAETALKTLQSFEEENPAVNEADKLETSYQDLELKLHRLDRTARPEVHAPILAAAIPLAPSNHERAKRLFGPDDPRTMPHFQNVFIVAMYVAFRATTDKFVKSLEAEAIGTELLAAQRRVLGEAHPDTLSTQVQFAKILGMVGKWAEDEKLQMAGIALQERVLGPDHQTLAIAVRQLAINHLSAGRYQEAAEYYQRFAASVAKRHGWESMRTRSFLHELGYVMPYCGEAAAAEAFARERLPDARQEAGEDGAGVIGLKFVLGAALVAQKRGAEAEPLLRECLAFALRQPEKSWGPESLLGAALLQQKKYAEAEPLLVQAFEENLRHRREVGGLSWLRFTTWDKHARLVQLYTEWNQPEKVNEWRKRAAEIPFPRPSRPPAPPATTLNRPPPADLSFATNGLSEELAPEWMRAGSMLDRFDIGLERDGATGRSLLRIASQSAEDADVGAVTRSFSTGSLRGKRVRLTFQLRSDRFSGPAKGTLRLVRDDGALIAYTERHSLGTPEWANCQIVYDVPETGAAFTFAFQLRGRGSVWIRDPKLDVVGTEIPADNTLEHIGAPRPPKPPTPISDAVLQIKSPQNLAFADAASDEVADQLTEKPPSGWFVAGSAPSSYRFKRDPTTRRTGPFSLLIKSVDAPITGFGTVMQSFAAAAYRGQRVRFSAWVKTREVERGAPIFLRIDQSVGRSLRFDNLGGRAPRGTSDWTRCEIVFDVPAEAMAIALGFFVSGTGEAWFADAQFEVVGAEVPTTDS